MITKSVVNVVERHGVVKESQFRIKPTGKAFRILSDGLYSDKITAIIRELGCNAIDAHMEVGNNDPFLIHLPNMLEPWFAIRDYGTGLSHDDMLNVYTTYFESTKENSNDMIGCLGLGSKSPYCYVDNFSVISYYNGEASIYNAFINETGCPSITHLSSYGCDEHNGIEIKFAVKSEDFLQFENKAKNVLKYFKLMPVVQGIKDSIAPIKYAFRGKNWGIRANGSYPNHSMAIMGNVAYPLQNFNFGSDEIKNLLTFCPLDIEFDIGEVEVSASREQLSFDKHTVETVLNKVNDIVNDIPTEIQKGLDVYEFEWDARCMLNELRNGIWRVLDRVMKDVVFTFKGKPIQDNYIFNGVKGVQLHECSLHYGSSRRKYNRGRIVKKKVMDGIRPANGLVFIENDEKNKSNRKIKQHILDNNIESAIMVQFRNAKCRNEFINHFGMRTFEPVFTSTMLNVGIERANYKANPKSQVKVFEYDFNNYYDTASDYWKPVTVDMEQGGMYLIIDRYKICGNGGDPIRVVHAINDLKKMFGDIGDVKVYGFKISIKDKIVGNKKWVNFFDWVRAKCGEFIEMNPHVLSTASIHEQIHGMQYTNLKFRELIMAIFMDMDDKDIPEFLKPMIKIEREIAPMIKDSSSYEILKNWVNLKNYKCEKFNLPDYVSLFDRYPMLSVMDHYNVNQIKQNVVKDYIMNMERVIETKLMEEFDEPEILECAVNC